MMYLSREERAEILAVQLKENGLLSCETLKKILGKEFIPLLVFRTNKLAPLEALVKYLKEELSLSYHEIAVLTARNDRTIWKTYKNASKKEEKNDYSASEIFIPAEVFASRKLSILESLISHLIEKKKLRMPKIASIIGKDNRMLWTIYARAKKKRNK
jgi:hypothetical protein